MSQHRRRPFSWQEPASTAREHLYGDQNGRHHAQDRPYLGRTRSMAGRRPSATPPWSPVIPEAPGRTPSTAHALGAPGWVYHQAQSDQDLLWSVEDDSSPEPSLAGVNHLPHCHTIHIPLRLGPWSDYRTLQLCLHPDWILEPDAVFHLVRNSVSQSSQRPPHPPALESTHYEPADLWSHHVGPLDSPASTRATSVCLDPAPTRSTTKSPSPAETEIEYGTTERQAEARDGGFDGSTAVGVWAVSMLVLLASLMAYVVTFQGHPAWVKTSSVNETWPISLWDLYDSLQTDYEHVLVPLVIPFQTTDPASDDFHSIIAALKLELSEVGFGITSWNISRAVPGPAHSTAASSLLEPGQASISLARRTELAIQALNAMSKTWMSLVSWTDALTGGIGSRVLTVTLREIAEDPDRSEQEKARASLRSINGSVSIIAQRNHDCLMTLKSIDENLRSIGPELDFILSQVGQGIRPHIHLQNYNRGWIIRTLDAVDYSSQYLVPIFQLLSRHVDKAIVRLSAANTTLASHREHYELVTATGGVADRTSMRYSSDTQTKWSSWFLKEETAKIQYVLENKTINELFLVAQRSAEMRQFLKTDDEEWNYYKIRPQRPPLH